MSKRKVIKQKDNEIKKEKTSIKNLVIFNAILLFFIAAPFLILILYGNAETTSNRSGNQSLTNSWQNASSSFSNVTTAQTVVPSPIKFISTHSPSTTKVLPTTNPTQIITWKTYSDKVGGFSFKYPANWIYTYHAPYSTSDIGYYYFSSPEYLTAKSQGGSYLESVLNGEQLGIIVQKTDSVYNPLPSGPADYFSEFKDVLVNNVKIHVSLNYNNLGRIAQADLITNDKSYRIYLNSNQNQDSLFYQILSTFTFFNK
jgi:hypothetical protein